MTYRSPNIQSRHTTPLDPFFPCRITSAGDRCHRESDHVMKPSTSGIIRKANGTNTTMQPKARGCAGRLRDLPERRMRHLPRNIGV